MRIYNNCTEMLEETYREIWKRGQTIFDKTVQGKIVSEKEFEQKELIFYNFRVDNFDDLQQMLDNARNKYGKQHIQYQTALLWFADMVDNPTLLENWWDITPYTKDYFNKFCREPSGVASYSYGERIIPQLDGLVKRLLDNKYSRGAIISMNIADDINRRGRRIPCTISYHFLARPTREGDKLNLIVNMRSGDAINFFPLDFAKSTIFLKYIASEINMNVGYVIMNIDTLHVYAKDVPEEYKW